MLTKHDFFPVSMGDTQHFVNLKKMIRLLTQENLKTVDALRGNRFLNWNELKLIRYGSNLNTLSQFLRSDGAVMSLQDPNLALQRAKINQT